MRTASSSWTRGRIVEAGPHDALVQQAARPVRPSVAHAGRQASRPSGQHATACTAHPSFGMGLHRTPPLKPRPHATQSSSCWPATRPSSKPPGNTAQNWPARGAWPTKSPSCPRPSACRKPRCIPAPRRLAWAIMALFVLALVWSIFGKVDIVAVAPGRIIVSDRTKLIQPLEASVVKRVLVKDGDRVQAGQVLVELDPTMATRRQGQCAGTAQRRHQRRAAHRSPCSRLWPRGKHPSLRKKADAGTQTQLQAEWQDISAKLAKLDAESQRRQAEMATVRETIAKLEATVPMAQAREAGLQEAGGPGLHLQPRHAGQNARAGGTGARPGHPACPSGRGAIHSAGKRAGQGCLPCRDRAPAQRPQCPGHHQAPATPTPTTAKPASASG